MTSHRAEAFGSCSILPFIDECFVFGNDAVEEPSLTLVCDDKALMDEVKAKEQLSPPVFPNDTLASDCDILQFLPSLCRKMSHV